MQPPVESSRVRFAFGANWQKYLSVVDDARIAEAERTLVAVLGVEGLRGKSFLDVGCGSGLFSLAARRLGSRVHSFDRDPLSVETTRELKRRHCNDTSWTIERGSITAKDYLARLDRYDVVYAWGVLHHTGDMWRAIENTLGLVADDGLLFLSIYNDQGAISRRWRKIKHLYNVSPEHIRVGLVVAVATYFETRAMIGDLIRFRNPLPFKRWTDYKHNRGMSRWHDLVDWVGGYPFEVATPEDVFDFCRRQGFQLLKLKTCGGGLGCNEFVFRKIKPVCAA
jgi:2-polyprenyl-3-methyl-5-hydroxy-6-metoxy-1,4-benzoquinol methylase